jgi:hypothetical protein
MDAFRRVGVVGADAAHPGGRQIDRVDPLLLKKGFDLGLPGSGRAAGGRR